MLKTSMQLLLVIKLNISIDKLWYLIIQLVRFFRSCKILFGLVKFMTAPDRMSGNVWKVFVNTGLQNIISNLALQYAINDHLLVSV